MRRHRHRNRPDPKVALVTGASSGIGQAFARELPQGTDLILTGRDEEALRGMALELAGPERRIEVIVADLATEAGLNAVVEAANAMPIDLLVNNAGTGQFGRFLEIDPEAQRTTLRVNAEAPMMLCARLLPEMLARARLDGTRAGLINVVSTAAFTPVPRFGVYAASKAYVLSLTETLTSELQRDPIDILALCPGPVRTPFGERAGFDSGALPGAVAPQRVAQRALQALGHRGVVFTDPPSELTLAPLVHLRSRVSWGINFGIGAVQRFRQRSA